MSKKKWLLIAAIAVTVIAVGFLITFQVIRHSQRKPINSSVTLESGSEDETEETEKETDAVEETGPSYPVVELDVPPIEVQNTNVRMEAEDAVFSGLLIVENIRTGYSGQGYLAGFEANPGDLVQATYAIEAAQHYDITISVCADTVVTNALLLNGERLGEFTIEESGHFVRVTFSGVYLPKGEVTLSIEELDGHFALDYFEITDFKEMYQMEYRDSYELCNKNASENAKKLMEYMSMHYGAKMLTGQYAANDTNTESDLIFRLTGKIPAIRFGDLEGYTQNSTAAKSNAIAACESWAERGGIVGLMWHWDAPTGVSSVYSKDTDFSLIDALTDKDLALLDQEEIDELYDEGGITEECYTILRDIDSVSAELKVLAEKDIPVLWRPLHEASGDWFWWGSDGSNAYRWLWELLYTRMTEYHELNNLIWVWNGQSADYLVDENMYDIASLDIYLPEETAYSSRYEQFVLLSRMTGGEKMLALSETSSIPNMNDMFRDNCIWSFFGLWYGEYLIGEDGEYSEKYTTADDMVALYNSEAVLTLGDTAAYFLDGEEPEELQKPTAMATEEMTEESSETTETQS
ncbi:MAG: hypothetical protein E7504_05430 [Ruminococcus sp.]|nr:hypothetical protein [Ruminococcus sp.]